MPRSEETHFYRQIMVLGASCLHSFSGGMMHAFPSVLNAEILSPNATDIKVTPDEASWIAGAYGFSGILGFAVLSPLLQLYGRKPVNITLNMSIAVGWVILYYANSFLLLLTGRLVQGLSLGGIYIVAISLGESSHKKRRGYFMTLKKVSVASGSLACHSLGLFYGWREIIIFGIIVISLSTILIIICPESPSFLAMKGRFDESRKAFHWLFGNSLESKKELDELITTQMISIERKKREKKKPFLWDVIQKTLQKDFQRPFFIVVFATLAMDACGRYFMLAYTTQIMVDITRNVAISMYCSLVSDCLLILALSISCVIVKTFNRRSILFRLGSMTVFLMFAVSVSVTVTSKFHIEEFKWLTSTIILLNSFVSHLGLVPVIFALTAEIFPLELKGIGSFVSGVIFSAFYFFTLKLTPLMMNKTGIAGTFMIYGSCVLISLVVLYLILPETKDKTLQEIENEIRGINNCTELDLLKTNVINNKD